MIISKCILNVAVQNIMSSDRGAQHKTRLIDAIILANSRFNYSTLSYYLSHSFNHERSSEGILFWSLVCRSLSNLDGVYMRDREFFDLVISGFPDEMVQEMVSLAVENPIR